MTYKKRRKVSKIKSYDLPEDKLYFASNLCILKNIRIVNKLRTNALSMFAKCDWRSIFRLKPYNLQIKDYYLPVNLHKILLEPFTRILHMGML